MFGDSGGASVFFYDSLDGTRSETAEIARSINGVLVTGIVEKKSGEGIGTGGEIFADAVGGGLRDEDGAVLLTFATDDKFAAVEIDGIAIEIDKFRNAETAREEKLDDGAVAETRFGVIWNGVQKVFYFVVMEKSNLFFGGAGKIDEGRIKGLDVAASKVFKKAAEGDEMVSLSNGLESGAIGISR